MKFVRWIYIISFVIFSVSTQAQFESNKKKIKLSIIPKKEAPLVAPKTVKPKQPEPQTIKYESQFFKKPEDKILEGIAKAPKIEIAEKKNYEVKSAGELYEDRFKKREGEIQERFKSDTFLGQFSTGSKTIRISCRDHEAPDGDRVRIWLNGQVAVNEIVLDVNFREIFLALVDGFNTIEIEALNQGESGPNTAQFVIVNDKGNIITTNKWNLTTGVKAKVIVLREDVMEKE